MTCVVEIPKGSRNTYEYDPKLGAIKLDRFISASVGYPTDYGYVPDTLAADGDALDALVCVSEPTFPGCYVLAKATGLFRMADEKVGRRRVRLDAGGVVRRESFPAGDTTRKSASVAGTTRALAVPPCGGA